MKAAHLHVGDLSSERGRQERGRHRETQKNDLLRVSSFRDFVVAANCLSLRRQTSGEQLRHAPPPVVARNFARQIRRRPVRHVRRPRCGPRLCAASEHAATTTSVGDDSISARTPPPIRATASTAVKPSMPRLRSAGRDQDGRAFHLRRRRHAAHGKDWHQAGVKTAGADDGVGLADRSCHRRMNRHRRSSESLHEPPRCPPRRPPLTARRRYRRAGANRRRTLTGQTRLCN